MAGEVNVPHRLAEDHHDLVDAGQTWYEVSLPMQAVLWMDIINNRNRNEAHVKWFSPLPQDQDQNCPASLHEVKSAVRLAAKPHSSQHSKPS